MLFSYYPNAIANADASSIVAPTAPSCRIDPVTKRLPVVVISPVVALIVKGPTVSPLWTTKFLLAIVPYLPNVLYDVLYVIYARLASTVVKKIAP
jgi:hypothetical protein